MKTKLLFIAILIVLIFPTFSFFLGGKMFTFNDETQIVNLYHYFEAIDHLQFPPRWAAGMHFEYGSPFLGFNYQLPYYLGYLGHLAGLPLVIIFKWLMVASIIIGALGMFLAGLTITGSNLFALFAAILYAYTPYQSIDHYIRGSLGEVYALALFPWIYLVGTSLLLKNQPIKVASLGLLLGLLILSHQPAALLALPFFLLIFVPSSFLSGRTKVIPSYLKSVLIGLLLSAYYWVPVILEKRYIVVGGPFKYIDQFPFIKQLLYSPWKYAGANPFSTDTFSFQIGLINLLIIFFSVVYFFFGLFKRPKSTSETWLFRFTLALTLIAVFLMNIRSDFIWRSFGLLQQIQFPWRLLMFTTWFTPLLFLLIIKNLSGRWTRLLTFVLIVAAIAINVGYFRPGTVTDRDDNYYKRILLPGSAEYSNFAEDYAPLPANAIRPKSLPSSKLTSMAKSTVIETISSNPYNYTARVENSATEILTFHTFYYPGWTVMVDNYPSEIKPDKIGAITFDITPGKHHVKISFVDTPLRLFSNIISLSTSSFTLLYLIYYLFRKRASTTA